MDIIQKITQELKVGGKYHSLYFQIQKRSNRRIKRRTVEKSF